MKRVGIALIALAAVVLPRGAAQASVDAARWPMNEPSGSTMFDASGNGNDGTISDTGVSLNGDWYTFAGSGDVVVPSSGTLNPGSQSFSFGVTLRTQAHPGTGKFDFDVLRKGLDGKGELYKLELLPANSGASASCFFQYTVNGTVTKAAVKKGKTLNDGNWHTVACSRTSTTISITIDGVTRTKSVATGTISNNDDFLVGAKALNDDEYIGDLQDAWVSVG